MSQRFHHTRGCNHATGEFYITANGKDFYSFQSDALIHDGDSYDPELSQRLNELFDKAFDLAKSMAKDALLEAAEHITK